MITCIGGNRLPFTGKTAAVLPALCKLEAVSPVLLPAAVLQQYYQVFVQLKQGWIVRECLILLLQLLVDLSLELWQQLHQLLLHPVVVL